jgi:hypothetical protein
MELRTRTNRDTRNDVRRFLAKAILVSGSALAAANCGGSDSQPCDSGHGGTVDSGTTDAGTGGDGGTVDAGCTPRTPVCGMSQSNSFLADKGMVVPVGDYRIRLNDTKEVGSEQVAVVSRVDTCNAEQSTPIEISEDSSGTFTVGTATIRVSASSITVTAPQQARLTVELVCPDSGTGGMDAGTNG